MDGYVDLAYSDDELKERESANAPLVETPKYPYGTSFSLEENTLDKIDHEDWKVGDVFHFHVMAKITGINSNENHEGSRKCVNFQMTAIRGESETAEDEEDEAHEPYHHDKKEGPDLAKYGYLRYE